MICISRIYAIDGTDTNITAEADNAQAALRLVEKAAEELGAAPEARNMTPAPKEKGKGGRPKKDAVTAKAEETTPALPMVVETFTPPGYPLQITAEVPLSAAKFTAEPVWKPEAPKVEFSGPPVFAPPPPVVSTIAKHVEDAAAGIKSLVGSKNPAWMGNVSETIGQILGAAPLASLSDAQLTERLGQLRQYEDMLKGHLGG